MSAWVDESGNPAPEWMTSVLAEADRIFDALDAGDVSVLGDPIDVDDALRRVRDGRA